MSDVVQMKDGCLYCLDCRERVMNTANNEMRMEGCFSYSHDCPSTKDIQIKKLQKENVILKNQIEKFEKLIRDNNDEIKKLENDGQMNEKELPLDIRENIKKLSVSTGVPTEVLLQKLTKIIESDKTIKTLEKNEFKIRYAWALLYRKYLRSNQSNKEKKQ